MTKATFNTWLRDARLLTTDGEEFVVGVRNDYARDWLENRLHDTIVRTLTAIVEQPVDLRYVVWSDDTSAPPPSTSAREPAPERANGHHQGRYQSNGVSNLNSHYTFANFVVGPSNRLAHAAALSVAERPGQTYNPLFIYGGVGLGKTHLLHAVGHRCHERGLRICYVTSETFTNDLIQSIRAQQMAEFREKYRTADVLLIDDVQFIAGKESTQEELFHTFNDLHSMGKQVVLSSDRPPKAMATLEERLKSRFEWGLMADIQLPDIETRTAILRSKAEGSGVHVPADVMDLIAHQVRNNIRELEGALTKVVAFAQLTGAAIDMNLVHIALADLVQQPRKVTVERVIDIVADYYGLAREAITGASRSRAVAFPRQVCMYLARTETEASFPRIGRKLGNRDHTTILYGYEKISGVLETNAELRRDVLALKSALYEAVPA